MTEDPAPKSPSEPTAPPIKGKRIRRALKRVWVILNTPIMIKQFLKKMWAILRPRITTVREWVVRVLKKIRNFCAKFIPKPKDASEKSWVDTFFETRTYGTILILGVIGMIVLPGLATLSLLSEDTLEDTLEAFGISRKGNISEFSQNIYYIFLFLGALLAAAIATWRGRQSEREISQSDEQIRQSGEQIRQSDERIQVSALERRVVRFEKAVDMAIDPKSRIRREAGFQILKQMFAAWGENFDEIIRKNLNILIHLSTRNFKMTDKQRRDFLALYKRSRTSYEVGGGEDAKSFYEKTHKPFINTLALDLWQQIVNWRIAGKLRESTVNGIDGTQVSGREASFFIASGMDLEDIKFLINLADGKIGSPSQGAYVNFKVSCFMLIDMCGADVSYVDFTKSHLEGVNRLNKMEDCNMKCIGTKFDFANLIDCNFRGADLEGASFLETNISGSDFSRAKNLTTEQFKKGAYWIRPGRPQFPESWTDSFIDFLDKDAQDEEEKGQGESEG